MQTASRALRPSTALVHAKLLGTMNGCVAVLAVGITQNMTALRPTTNISHARSLDVLPLQMSTAHRRVSADIKMSFVTGLGDMGKVKGVTGSIRCDDPEGLTSPTLTITSRVMPLRAPVHPVKVIQGAVVGELRWGPTGSVTGMG